MADVDLIPQDYRQQRILCRILQRFTVLLICLLLVIGGLRFWVGQLVSRERQLITQLEAGEVVILNRRKQYEELKGKRADLIKRQKVLDVLRGGPPAERMFVVIDKSINDSTWITSLKFARGDEESSKKPTTRNVGYFIVVSDQGEDSDAPGIRSHLYMDMQGQVYSHSALAGFVSNLLSQPEVNDVKVVRTSSREYSQGRVIDYTLDIAIEAREGRI